MNMLTGKGATKNKQTKKNTVIVIRKKVLKVTTCVMRQK